MRRNILLTILLLAFTTASAQSTFSSTLAAKAAKGATIYGTVECNGTPLEGVAVSDGYNIVKTDSKGVYNIVSEKRNGSVFITLPSGYEAYTTGDDVVPQFWAHLTAEPTTAERHDFNLRKVDNNRHVIVAVTDIHLANRLNDVEVFTNSFVPSLTAEIEQYRKQGIPVYTICMGDSSFDLYWYDYNYDISDFRRTLAKAKYPTQFFNSMGNHDNDGATPYDENTDFNATAKYRKAFGPTYYSFNLGKVHYIMLDNQLYLNEPSPKAKKASGIVGARNNTPAITREQMDWLAKDLATVTDPATPIVIGLHSPIFRYKNYMDGEIDIRLPEEQQQEFVALLKPFKSVNILSGHTHRNVLRTVDTIGSLYKRLRHIHLVQPFVITLLQVDNVTVARTTDLYHRKTVDGGFGQGSQAIQETRSRNGKADTWLLGKIATDSSSMTCRLFMTEPDVSDTGLLGIPC